LAAASVQSSSVPSVSHTPASSCESAAAPNAEKSTSQAITVASERTLASSIPQEPKSEPQAIEPDPHPWWGKPKHGQISMGPRVAAFGALRGQRRNGHTLSCCCQDCKRIFEEDAARYFDRAVTDGKDKL